MPKVSIIGAGNVGATTAQLLLQEGIAEIVLYDLVEGLAKGKALDMRQAASLWGVDYTIKGTDEINDIRDSEVVVITAGAARRPGMSRDDLLKTNARVVSEVSEKIKVLCPEAVVIVVTNPMDVMAQLCWHVTGFDHKRIVGMGGVLDSARFRTFVAEALGVSVRDTEALVLGGHGDQMVPMPRFTTVRGIPITELLSDKDIKALIERTRNGGAEIVALLKTGSAYYAPAASTVEMVRSVLFDEKRLLPAAAYLDGEFGVKGLFIGVPIVLGRTGIERIIELPLEPEERRAFEASVEAVKRLVSKLID